MSEQELKARIIQLLDKVRDMKVLHRVMVILGKSATR